MKKIVLVGGGGHCKVAIDAIRKADNFEIDGVVDARLKKGKKILEVPVIGNDDILPKRYSKGVKYAFIAIGSVGDCTLRKALYKKIIKLGFKIPCIIHPKAVVAADVKIGEGTFVAAGAVINPGTKIGRNTIINTSSSIDHDCQIGDFVHIAPGTTLSGGVKVGDETHIGTGANIIQYLTIGKKCVVGAGTTVRHNIKAETRFLGTYTHEKAI